VHDGGVQIAAIRDLVSTPGTAEATMGKILGVGGVFLKSPDPTALRAWYERVLGLKIGDWGVFFTPDMLAAQPGAGTVLSLFSPTTEHFAPSNHDVMLNLIVDDMATVLAHAAEAGVTPIHQQDDDYGTFAHILDPEGRKLELWQPKAS
jgi:predicted enzyme related to lactoylglutathione lyase